MRQFYDFLLKICCLTVPKNFVGEPFCVSQSFWYRKKLWIRVEDRGSVTIFRQKFFVSVSKLFVGEHLSALLISGIEIFMPMNGISRIFVESSLSHSTGKNLLGNTSVFHKVSGNEKLMDKSGGEEKGVSRFSFTTFFSHKDKIFRKGTLQCFLNFGYGKFLCL